LIHFALRNNEKGERKRLPGSTASQYDSLAAQESISGLTVHSWRAGGFAVQNA
jgi:hypothetical protein